MFRVYVVKNGRHQIPLMNSSKFKLQTSYKNNYEKIRYLGKNYRFLTQKKNCRIFLYFILYFFTAKLFRILYIKIALK